MTRPRQTTKKKPKRDPNMLDITQVSLRIGSTYQAARNMMLRKVFGEPHVREHGTLNKLSVSKVAVLAWLATRKSASDGSATL